MINTKYRSILALLLVSGSSALAIEVFDVRVATTKVRYYPGEQIEIRITVPTPGVLSFGTSLQTLYTMDQVYTPNLVGLQIPTQTTTPHTWTMAHDWRAYNLAQGHHTVVGRVVGYGSSPPAGFDVVPPPAPSGNFVLDFDTIPGTGAPVAHLLAYDALGVHFRTSLGAACELHGDSRGKWVEGFDRYPIGFNVAADFAMPVFGASAKVAGGTGVRITMTARNARGQAIATAVSTAMAQPGQFAQTLFVTAVEPIASLEWRPSLPSSGVGVDDLLVVTAPVLNHALVDGKLRLMWGTLTGANYQLFSSTDLTTWTPVGPVLIGNGGVLTNNLPATESKRFLRVSRSN